MVRGYLFTNSVLDALEIEQRYLQANLLNDNITFILLLKLLSIYILSKKIIFLIIQKICIKHLPYFLFIVIIFFINIV